MQSTSPSRKPTRFVLSMSLIRTAPLQVKSLWQLQDSKVSPSIERPLDVSVTNKKKFQPCLPSFSPLKQTLGSICLAIGTRLEPWRELRGEFSLCGSRFISGERKLDITRGTGESSLLYTGIMIAKWANRCLVVGFHVYIVHCTGY